MIQESEITVSILLYEFGAKVIYFDLPFVNKNASLMTVSVETVLMAKYRSGKNQFQRSD